MRRSAYPTATSPTPPWSSRPGPSISTDVRCPVGLWYGEHDGQAPARNGVWLAAHLPTAELRVLPGLGHVEALVRSWPEVLAGLL